MLNAARNGVIASAPVPRDHLMVTAKANAASMKAQAVIGSREDETIETRKFSRLAGIADAIPHLVLSLLCSGRGASVS